MGIFLFILINNIIPISILVIIGYTMNRKFDLNINTMSKLNFYLFVPSFTFVNLYTTKIPREMSKVILSAFIILFINWALVTTISKFRGHSEGFRGAFANSVLFFNAGNIGVPLITLVFSSPPFIINGETPYLSLALTTQIMILVTQNITSNTVGFLNAGCENTQWKESISKVLKMPTIYAVLIALILKYLSIDITQSIIWPPLNYSRNALVPVALLSLGVQLSKTKFDIRDIEVYLAVFSRLIIGPLLAIILILLFKIDGIVAQVFVIALALPTSVNSALIAVEYDNFPNFSSQVVMVSTIFSAISLVAIIYMARVVFPI
ncbi:AEC family transporter [Serpentinicella alkaliphila]|uniref:Permease n=1 Tax=Serpentinicella alkaliphila TaxID=1734049 RepID=A0A4R2TPM6_9FIRM|nr:AEC family transporter [Serpentinicella alkaliphila]QUH26466.1 AEC family transporter [Serpentinicella alkaliphila]TCQ03255.1 hypothetical protein EDD79_101043 [Serpentinicella alkaliphila]